MVKDLVARTGLSFCRDVSIEAMQAYLDKHDTFSSVHHLWFPKSRLPASYKDLPNLTMDILGDDGVHGIIALGEDNLDKDWMGRVLPIGLNRRGYVVWTNALVSGHPNDLGGHVNVRYVFDDIHSPAERDLLLKAVQETEDYFVQALGYSPKEVTGLKKNNLNFSAHAYRKNPRSEYHAGGGFALRNSTTRDILAKLFDKVDADDVCLPDLSKRLLS